MIFATVADDDFLFALVVSILCAVVGYGVLVYRNYNS